MEIESYKYLESIKIDFQKKEFSPETEKGASNVAKVLNLKEDQVVKTLIFETDSAEFVLVMVPANKNAISSNLKKAIGSRNIKMADPEKIKEVTGYVVGSIPPFGWQKEGFRNFIDYSLMNEKILAFGAGTWGYEILISPDQFKKSLKTLSIVNLCNKDEVKLKSNLENSNILNYKSIKMDDVSLILEKDKKTIKQLSSHVGEAISLEAWLYNKRESGKIAFLQIRDGSGFVQAVAEESKLSSEVWEEVKSSAIESSVQITGTVTKHPKQENVFELQVADFKVINTSPEFPIGKKEHGPEFLFENRDLYLRSKTPWAVLRIRDQVFRSITNFFYEEGFIRFDTPVLQPTSCEDTTQLFGLEYYDSMMYLTQSGQLYLEAGIMSFGKAYDFGPVFRAEKSKTRNHLSEFWMMDAEMAFYDQDMNEDLQERMVKRILKDALENCREELILLERDTKVMEKCVAEPFKRIKHYDAKKLLETEYGMKVDYDDDMTTEEEIQIGNHFGIPTFIEDYPFAIKSFYMKTYVDERGMKRARNADLIAPEEAREIIGGSQREEDYDALKSEVVARNYSLEDYDWYLNIRKYGSVKHSGFGIGLERTVRWISGVHHIRETIPFPRTTVLSRP